MPTLAMIRHGQSQWNLENRFTGWHDVDLTEEGRAQAKKSGELLAGLGVEFDCAFASVQTRAIRTLWIALDEMNRMYLPVVKDWRLNERHYGALTGLDKADTAAKHGEEQLKIWRRSYDTPPPPLADDDPRHPKFEKRYAKLPPEVLPATESLKTTLDRALPFYLEAIEPKLADGENVLIAAHGNSLRALAKHILGISDEDIVNLEIPTGNPLIFDFDEVKTKPKSVRYLDEARATELPKL